MSHDVFISFSSQDKAIADAVCATLEARKIRCWIAPRDVLPGLPYAEALSEALSASKILVLVFSSGANRSVHVMREVESAIAHGFPVVPLRVEDVLPTKSLDYFLKAIHWLDALTPPLEQHLQALAETVRLLLLSREETGGIPKEAPRPGDVNGKATPGEGTTGRRRRRAWRHSAVVGGGVFLLLAAVSWVAWLANHQPPPGASTSAGAEAWAPSSAGPTEVAGPTLRPSTGAPAGTGQEVVLRPAPSPSPSPAVIPAPPPVMVEPTAPVASLKQLHGWKSPYRVSWVGFMSGGRQAAFLGGGERKVHLWDMETNQELPGIAIETSVLADRAALAPDGKHLLVSEEHGDRMGVWDLAAAQETLTLSHPNGVASVAYSPDGKRALSGGWQDGTARLWDLATGAELLRLDSRFTELYNPVRVVRFSRDGLRALVARDYPDDGRIVLWDLADPKDRQKNREVVRLGRTSTEIYAAALSADGREVFLGEGDGTVHALNLDTRAERVFRGPVVGARRGIVSLALSPDGRRLLSGAVDGTVTVWDLDKGVALQQATGHTKLVLAVAFSADGRRALSGSLDTSVCEWALPD